MNKYFSIYNTSFCQESKTIANSLVSVVSFIVIIYIFQQLWQFIYGGNGGGTLLNGYTLQMMIWYMIMAEVLMYSVNLSHKCISFSKLIELFFDHSLICLIVRYLNLN